MNIIDKENKIEKLKNKIGELDRKQFYIKILLNRAYGYLAEQSSPFYDIDMASSVTLTGQNCVKVASEHISNYIKNNYLVDYDPIVANDTDSIIMTIEPILLSLNESFLINDKINPKAYEIADNINRELNDSVNTWARDVLKSTDTRYEFKRENLTSIGAFLKKKHYILNIRDDEGIAVDKFKYTGVEVVRTSTPKKVKPFIKKVIESIIKKGNLKYANDILQDYYEDYQKFKIEDISITMGLSDYEKGQRKSIGFKIGKNVHINNKAAIYYNTLLDKMGLANKYEKIKSGNKLKFVYLQPNMYDMNVIGFLNVFPEEFNSFLYADYGIMFDKTVMNAINRVMGALNLKLKNPTKLETNLLLDLFGDNNA